MRRSSNRGKRTFSMIKCSSAFNIRCALVAFFLITLPVVYSQVWAHGWKAPKPASKMENPLPSTPEVLKSGETLYQDFCSSCHGMNARGGSSEELGLSMAPPDLVKRLKEHSPGDFYWKINHGRGDMPGFKDDLEPDEVWGIIRYIEGLIPEQ
ncbi:MAG TPA: hypothetical protein DHV36_01090 [Desulfobacteraceae bacterium]|nr:hypothetical protein [Desulfobacteraceae bacterium]